MALTGKSMIPILVAGRCGVPLDQVEKVLQAWDWVLLNELSQGNTVRVAGCGLLEVKVRAARRKRLPGQEAFMVPEKKAITFRQTRTLEDALKNV